MIKYKTKIIITFTTNNLSLIVVTEENKKIFSICYNLYMGNTEKTYEEKRVNLNILFSASYVISNHFL